MLETRLAGLRKGATEIFGLVELREDTVPSSGAHESELQNFLLRYEAESVLFARRLSRLDLLGIQLPDQAREPVMVNVWRNHAFESLIPLMEPYIRFGNWRVDFVIGGYDDTLTFNTWQQADLELLWLDSSRFDLENKFSDWLDWLRGRLIALRRLSKAAIIVTTWVLNEEQAQHLREMTERFADIYYADVKKLCEDEPVPLIDRRTAKLAGTPVSNAAQLIVARELACHWLPAVVLPPMKAIAVDLDHTLHFGELGDDGIDGVQLTAGHRKFQEFIKTQQQRGIFIALVSRNQLADVEALFESRKDYPLRWDDFSVVEVSWGDKPSAVERIAGELRIAPDAMLFVDDNPGELAQMCTRLPQVHTVYADRDPELTLRAVDFYPGLWRWKVESEDLKRIQDLRANTEREAIADHSGDAAEYVRSLRVNLVYRHAPREQLSRLADLCNKTNQFNLALRRFSQVELLEYLDREDASVASVQLADRLSDSGVIAALVAVRQGERLVVQELCISCRALGRQLEDTIILVALRGMPIFPGCQEVAFRVGHGPRNQPALKWLARLLDRNEDPEAGLHSIPARRVLQFEPADGVTLQQE